MKLSDFDYNLDKRFVAQKPVSPRDSAKLLILHKKSGQIEHRHFTDLLDFLCSGDLLVMNDTKVFPARLLGRKQSGTFVELLLDHEIEPGIWLALGRKVKIGDEISFPCSGLLAQVIAKEDRAYKIKFSLTGSDFFSEVEKIGKIPLPPYIREGDQTDSHRESYQTVYATNIGSVAAPTAGLHFTKELLEKIKGRGISVAKVTLHVGMGTFLPVETEEIKEHKMHKEYFSVSKSVLSQIVETKAGKGRVVAVGTTSTRVLEYLFGNILKTDTFSNLPPQVSGWTEIFIYPGYRFKCIDGLITNFHLPKSTLLILVSALAGRSNVLNAYQNAIENNYRFFSYGDAMLII